MTIKPLTGKVLITGGTGSLGTAILRRAMAEGWDAEFSVISRGEGKQSQMRGRFPTVKFYLGDVRDLDRLRILFRGQDTVIHAAAYKQVPSSQVNVSQTMEVNVRGSFNVIQAALENCVKTVIGISTDKAAEPVNAYGASKSIMESMFQEANAIACKKQKFALTRYGNVIGSRGSVIPFFLNQARSGKNITVTDWEMTRFWITLDQAVDLVLDATHVDPGVILVPKAPAMPVIILATLIREMVPTYHKKIHKVPIRPGEKIHECMVTKPEARHTVENGDLFYIASPTSDKPGNLPVDFTYTSDQAITMSDNAMRSAIREWEGQHSRG